MLQHSKETQNRVKKKESVKRVGNLYQRICSLDNLLLADYRASRGKSKQTGVIKHRTNSLLNLVTLQEQLVNKVYKTSKYNIFTIKEPKERTIHQLPYMDRIVHHAIVNVIGETLLSGFTADTYSCIPKRGIHLASYRLRNIISGGRAFCLKFDIRKFYETIDHSTLKILLKRKFKDKDLLWLLDEIIESIPKGLPLGNYMSQQFANYYLSGFDHWIKEIKKVKIYFRYMDDICILSNDKVDLWDLFYEIRTYLSDNLKLEVKGNYQVFPIDSRGIDFVGYVHYTTHTRLRKGIKQRFKTMMNYHFKPASYTSYYGWIKHCNGVNLLDTHAK